MASSSMFELNDTLQLTKEQGFPAELVIEKHLVEPYTLTGALSENIYTFTNKPALRNFVVPPVRTFLVENREGKWIYWGQCHILSVHLDYMQHQTSGTYRIIRLFTPEEMKAAFMLIDRVDRNEEINYFFS